MIDIRDQKIIIDGAPQVVLAGEVHYFRTPRDEWAQRLDRVLEIGCNAVASYIPWLFHELPDGSIDVAGSSRPERDLAAFIDLCAARGLWFIARPGPFVMAELKNEGLPYRIYHQHPEIIPRGWDDAPAPSRTVDYLSPAFLHEVDRWYAAVMPLLAVRLQPGGGPVIGVQLDNEIGMLAWVTNSPDLTDELVGDFRSWCLARYGDDLYGRYPGLSDPEDWRRGIRSPDEDWAAALRVDLGWFMRQRFARYVEALASTARRHGITDVPLLINIHGTEGGDGVPFAIGVSQLMETYSGRAGFVAGSDHYLGELTGPVAADLHFINTAMAAVNGPDQPLTSLEFEAGTGDYSGGLDALSDPNSIELKVRLCLAQGNRLINYYLLAGGINPRLDVPVDDGNDRISFTGERHGTGAPIGPKGERGLTFEATAAITRLAARLAPWLAGQQEEHDELALGFWPDAFMTEYHHPSSAVMTELVDDLVRFRGPGPRKALQRSLLFGGFRFTAVDLQDPAAELPATVVISCGTVLDADVQARLVAHLRGGGSLFLMGRLPERDTENRPCTRLADALGLRPGEVISGSGSFYPSVVGHQAADVIAETRVGWLAEILPTDATTLFTDVTGRVCGVITDTGGGRAVVITAELPSDPELFRLLLERLDCRPGLRLRTTVPGMIVTSSHDDLDQRLLHVINPTGYSAQVQVDSGDPTGLLDRPLTVPARTGGMLPLGLRIDDLVVVSANAELIELTSHRLHFAPPFGDHLEVWISSGRTPRGSGGTRHGDLLHLVRAVDDRVIDFD